MICYQDMTFCKFKDCKFFGEDCGRSFTEEVRLQSIEWWGSEEAPICFYADKPECYENNIDLKN